MDPIKGIVQFNVERGLTAFDPVVEYNLLFEELAEFEAAGTENDEYEMVDALCDIIVVAAGAIYKLGYRPKEALSETVKEILSRKGAINPLTGKWEKDRNQDKTTLYKADYAAAKR